MAITASRRHLQGDNSITRDSNGWSVRETWIVSGVDASNINDRWLDVIASVPAYGDAHDYIPGIYVSGLDYRLVNDSSTQTFLVGVTYGILAAEDQEASDQSVPIIEVGATTQTVSTEVDRARQLMKVGWFEEIWFENEEDQVTEQRWIYHEQVGTVDVQIPQTYYRLKRRETDSPANKAIDFVGKINSSKFFRFPPRTWLCTSIAGAYAGGVYDVSYDFIYNPSTWAATVSFVDPETGRVPPNVVIGDVYPAPPNAYRRYLNGDQVTDIAITPGTQMAGSIRQYHVYQEADFRLLNVEL